MPKEKAINPAQAQRKADKKKEIKKGKAAIQAQRTTRLAHRNPQKIQAQLTSLREIVSSGGKLTNHEKGLLEGLEKELKAVVRAKEVVGKPSDDRVLGKRVGGLGDAGGVKRKYHDRERNRNNSSEEDEEIDEDTKRIPMPRDTPPPIPKAVLDRWYARRRERLGLPSRWGENANRTPLGWGGRLDTGADDVGMDKTRMEEAKMVYEAKPVIRNLRKEAMAFVPAAVRAKAEKARGTVGLLEPEEADRLEGEGYAIGTGLGKGGDVEKGERDLKVGIEEVEEEKQ